MRETKNNAYGLQFMLDGYAADKNLCGDIENMYTFLMQFPESIGMRRVGFPHIIHITEEGIKGLSGFVFIMESHISIHTYEERGFITADVYSCKTFNRKAACDRIVSAFDIKVFETNSLVRGKQFNNTLGTKDDNKHILGIDN